MAGLYAMWVPGSAGLPYHGSTGSGYVGGGQYSASRENQRGGHGGAVALNIPTPVIVDGRRMRLAKIILLYKTLEDTKMTSVTVLDGERELFKRGDWATGDYSKGMFPENVIDFDRKEEVRFGVQVHISFLAPNGGGSMAFAGLGADFVDSI